MINELQPMCDVYPPKLGTSCLSYQSGPYDNPFQAGANHAPFLYQLTTAGQIIVVVLVLAAIALLGLFAREIQ